MQRTAGCRDRLTGYRSVRQATFGVPSCPWKVHWRPVPEDTVTQAWPEARCCRLNRAAVPTGLGSAIVV